MTLEARLRQMEASGELRLPPAGKGQTAERHRRLLEIAREDISLARLAEAHVDALAILEEADRKPPQGVIYGVWASEAPGLHVALEQHDGGARLNGVKMFCSGAGLVDRALITIRAPEQRLMEVNLRVQPEACVIDQSAWKTSAFAETRTATVRFVALRVSERDLVGGPEWYLTRPGFWHGACGPAACWAGGAIGLVDYALAQSRSDPHTLAHLGAMNADAWALRCYLEAAGSEIDENPHDSEGACMRALTMRHLIVEGCNDILRRLTRAYGPRPLASESELSRRYHELELYITQSHAERDLEVVGRQLLKREAASSHQAGSKSTEG